MNLQHQSKRQLILNIREGNVILPEMPTLTPNMYYTTYIERGDVR